MHTLLNYSSDFVCFPAAAQVNASGQFCGVAEMIGRVNFTKNMDFWQQDKWNGFFPVKWHIIKDVPNSQFRHIILENNDNKPVTNSRDTQEVRINHSPASISIKVKGRCCRRNGEGFILFLSISGKIFPGNRDLEHLQGLLLQDFYTGRLRLL